ncbi:MAG: hypothetical protein WAO00_16865, partial [Chthoniobacterales bacterium]
MNTPKQFRRILPALLPFIFSLNLAAAEDQVQPSGRTVVAEVVAFDQAFMLNRLGSALATPRIFALRKDVQKGDGTPLPGYNVDPNLNGYAGDVFLKDYKRARPIVLRANVGDILEIRFTNLLDAATGQFAGCHVMGLSLAESIDSDSSWVGQNNLTQSGSPSPAGGSFAANAGTPTPTPPPMAPAATGGQTRVYRYFVDAEGVFILYSAADPTGFNGNLNEAGNGLFGCVIVQPPDAEYYRSQVLRRDLIEATYDSEKLPANMVLHLEPKRPNEPESVEHWLLTTYKTRLHDFVVKNVEVEIVPDTGIQAQTAAYQSTELAPPKEQPQPKEQAKPKDRAKPKEQPAPKAAPPKMQLQSYVRDLTTGERRKGAVPPTDRAELRKAQEKGEVVPKGKLYSFASKHPLVDYPVAYGGDDGARPKGWPVLEMLYPEARALLTAQTANADRGIAKDAAFFKLQPSPETPDPQKKYASEITQLDTGNVPRDLWPVLNAWGIQEMAETPGRPKIIPRLVSQRDYFDLPLDQSKRISREGTANFIWLLTGVQIPGKKNAAVIIHGDAKDLTLRFLEVELQLFHSDLTAIITGPQAEGFGNMQHTPSAFLIPASPERMQPYREFALGYHNGGTVNQAFPEQRSPSPLATVTGNGNDNFGINYGMAGIATEILANRLGVGPQGCNKDGVDLKFEEFFLSSWAVGDPAMLVDRPANKPTVNPAGPAGPQDRATKVLYADDPSNVYHSYMRDHVKMRIYNAGNSAPHVHHLHAHQWLRSSNSDEASYLDSQLIVPGAAFSLEITYNGSGNRNQTVGDSIFHCHFYPHFAQGMWSLWRVHDVFENGTLLDKDRSGRVERDPAKWVRALPDGEIDTGTPIPAIVPLPTLAMPPLPPPVRVAKIPDLPPNPKGGPGTVQNLKQWVNISGDNPSMGRMVQVKPEGAAKDGTPIFANPGYPFFVPGVAGHRPPHPPLDMGWEEKDGVPDLNPDYTVSGVTNGTTFVMSIAAMVTGSNLSLTATNTNGSKTVPVPLSACSMTNGSTTVTCASTKGLVAGMSISGANIPPAGTKKYIDGGLPRHQVLGGQIVREFHTQWDFTKDYIRYEHEHEQPVAGAMVAYRVPEEGTPIEKAAMEAHRTRTVKTSQPDGRQGNFIHNGLDPVSGAPFADPGVDDEGNAVRSLRKYKAAVIQKDVVFNKAGWHYPQQRFITLWQDVKPTFDEKRPAQPFFFRANSGETVEYWHTNLVPEYYELDDFQVRTPTDIIGQHIHLVKFDVLASDGAVNGFNYEDGTISPDDVRGRIHAITRPFANQPGAQYNLFEMSQPKPNDANYVAGVDWSAFVKTTPTPAPWNGSYLQKEMSQGAIGKANPLATPAGQNWDGAMTTIQRFSTDPLLNDKGIDRTVRTVFTHDHFGPSTHQQAGLYAGFLVEPQNSVWRDPVTGGLYYDPVTRTDGGPTGWEAIIEPHDSAESYREFAVEFQDLQLAYTKDGANTLKHMKDFLSPIVIASPSPVPAAGAPVINVKVQDAWNNTVTLTEFLRQNGISLTDTAQFSDLSPGLGIVDDAANSVYQYGSKEPAAFSLEPDNGTTEGFTLRFLHGKTWASPGNAIGKSAQLNPQIVSGGGKAGGTYSVNYRNEPLAVNLPDGTNVGRVGPTPTSTPASVSPPNDMAFAYASIPDRSSPWNQTSPDVSASPCPGDSKVPPLFARPKDPADVNGAWYNPVGFACDAEKGTNEGMVSSWDPYTPLLRGYQGDPVQIRALVGAHMQPHSFNIHGVKWLGEMKSKNSGLRNAQEMGISEHFEFEFRLPPASTDSKRSFADYLYAPSSGSTGQANGVWGILRSYDNPPPPPVDPVKPPIASLRRLPAAANPRPYQEGHAPMSVKPPDVPDVAFTISAHHKKIVYNNAPVQPINLQNQQGIVYTVDSVQEKKGDALGSPLEGVSTKADDPNGIIPPLILRVKAGQWVKVTLKNRIRPDYANASTTIGLHSQLVAYDVSNSDGMNVGFNPIQTVPSTPRGADVVTDRVYWWYAGDLEMNAKGEPTPSPRELGATNLCPAAPLSQDGNGLLGALIVEPAESYWDPQGYVSQQAEILDPNDKKKLLFHDFVLIQQTNIDLSTTPPSPNGSPPPGSPSNSAVNNQSADMGFRLAGLPTPIPAVIPVWQVLSNSLPGVPGGTPAKPGPCGVANDPNTPVFCAKAGDPVRFRVLQPGGDSVGGNIMFEIHGHSWQQEPWTSSSRTLGDNPKSNVLGAEILVPHK